MKRYRIYCTEENEKGIRKLYDAAYGIINRWMNFKENGEFYSHGYNSEYIEITLDNFLILIGKKEKHYNKLIIW